MATNKTIEEKIAEGRQYRSIDLTEFESYGEDIGLMIVEGYATTFNEPYVLWHDDDFTFREQVDPAAFEAADMSDVIMQYDHAGRVFARISNYTLEVTPDEHGLRIRAKLGGTEIGRQLYEEIKGGYTNKMSFGFTVEEDRLDREDKEVLRTITKIGKLYDVSAVSLPANDATTISARSYCEGVIAEIREELAKREEEERKRQEKIKRLKLLTEL